MQRQGDHKVQGWAAKALLTSAASLLIGLVVTALLVAGVRNDVSPLRAVERAGNDFGLQILSRFIWLGGRSDQNTTYYFVDVDEKSACPSSAPDLSSSCLSRSPIAAKHVEEFLDAVRLSPARVAIIDVAPFDRREDGERVANALRRFGGAGVVTHVIVPMGGRTSATVEGQLRFNPDSALSLSGRGLPNLVHYAPFITAPDTIAGDGVIRTFPRVLEVSGARTTSPTAPFLAAIFVKQGSSSKRTIALPRAALDEPATTIIYTVPSLALLDRQIVTETDPTLRERLQRQKNRLFDQLGFRRITFAEMAASNRGNAPSSLFGRDSVVVLGSSMVEGMDWHSTPIGPMTGSELLLNTTRSFVETQLTGPSREGMSFIRDYSSRLKTLFLGSMIMALAWMGVYWLQERARDRRWVTRAVSKLLIFASFIAGLAGVATIEIIQSANDLGRSIAEGRSVDVLTPMLVLGLEGYVEGLKALASLVEHGLLLCWRALTTTSRLFLSRLAEIWQ